MLDTDLYASFKQQKQKKKLQTKAVICWHEALPFL